MKNGRFQQIADDVIFGEDVKVYDFVNLYGCEIGDDSRIGTFVEIQRGAKIGKRCKIQSHTFICEGVTIEDEVMVAHGVMFINDLDPEATTESGDIKGDEHWNCVSTRICRKASIGSNATILGGVTIGEGALVGAGSVVTRDVPPNTVVAGIPARVLRQRR